MSKFTLVAASAAALFAASATVTTRAEATIKCSGVNSCKDSNLAPIFEFDPSGKIVKSWGGGMFIFPHGIWIEKDGTIWLTDGQGANGKGQQVFKLSPEGKVLMTLGKAGVAGDGPDTFNQPNAVAIAPNGDIFVSDGHGTGTNERIVPYGYGTGPSNINLNLRVAKVIGLGPKVEGRGPGGGGGSRL